MDILNNARLIFIGAYLHYKDVSEETIFEKSIAKRTKLRRFDEIKKKKQNINNELFKTYFTDISNSK